MPLVFIGVGSNLGDRESHFLFAENALLKSRAIRHFWRSPVYETEPVESEGGKYWNAVWSFETDLGPRETFKMLQSIETKAGRARKSENDARTLDLDLLFYDDQVIQNPNLTVPHPRIEKRAFVLVPFCDLAPDWKHPVLKKTMKELLNGLEHGA